MKHTSIQTPHQTSSGEGLHSLIALFLVDFVNTMAMELVISLATSFGTLGYTLSGPVLLLLRAVTASSEVNLD